MIIENIGSCSKNVGKIIQYIAGIKSGGDNPANWVLEGSRFKERENFLSISNCLSDDIRDAALEIINTQNRNTRSKGPKHFHMVVSFPKGERPDSVTLKHIETALCAELGMETHQRISSAHFETDNFHFHLLLNKIDPKTFKIKEPFQFQRRLMRLSEKLELELGLTRTNHVERDLKGSCTYRRKEAFSGELSLVNWAKQHIAGALLGCSSWQDAHQLLHAHGLELALRGAGLKISTQDQKIHIKPSSLDRRLGFASLQQRWGAFEENLHRHEENKSSRHHYRKVNLYEQFKLQNAPLVEARRKALSDVLTKEKSYLSALKTFYQSEAKKIRHIYGENRKGRNEALSRLYDERHRDLKNWQEQKQKRLSVIEKKHLVMDWMTFKTENSLLPQAQAGVAAGRELEGFSASQLKDLYPKFETCVRETLAARKARGELLKTETTAYLEKLNLWYKEQHQLNTTSPRTPQDKQQRRQELWREKRKDLEANKERMKANRFELFKQHQLTTFSDFVREHARKITGYSR